MHAYGPRPNRVHLVRLTKHTPRKRQYARLEAAGFVVASVEVDETTKHRDSRLLAWVEVKEDANG